GRPFGSLTISSLVHNARHKGLYRRPTEDGTAYLAGTVDAEARQNAGLLINGEVVRKPWYQLRLLDGKPAFSTRTSLKGSTCPK
ncbi:MAG: hypothetical protein VX090_07965, partial [Pseudomonadota bacterium]|nr:hypothetical protein [Pseudomonadota bacterium]